MTALQVFQFTEQAQIRVRTDGDGAVWFVAADVCRVLEIKNSRDAIGRLDDDEKGVASTDTLGGKQNTSVVTEAGLYSLILSSRKPEARAFKRWITHEVLPAIARQGWYATPAVQEQINERLQISHNRLFERVEQLERQVQKLDARSRALEAEHEIGTSTKEFMSINAHRIQNALPLLDTFGLAKAAQKAAALSRQHGYGTVRAQRGGLLGANTLYHVAVLNSLIAEEYDDDNTK